jgi:hypothetical protein
MEGEGNPVYCMDHESLMGEQALEEWNPHRILDV